MPGRPMTRAETKEERKRTRTTKQYTDNSSNLVEEVTSQILFLDTKLFVIFTNAYFKSRCICKKNGLIVFFFPLFRNETQIFTLSY